MTTSWVIVRIEDGQAMFETFNKLLAEKVNKTKYKAVPILKYLVNFNKGVKNDQ